MRPHYSREVARRVAEVLQRSHGSFNLRNLLLVQAGREARPGRHRPVERPEGVAEPRREGGFRRVAFVPGGGRRDARADARRQLVAERRHVLRVGAGSEVARQRAAQDDVSVSGVVLVIRAARRRLRKRRGGRVEVPGGELFVATREPGGARGHGVSPSSRRLRLLDGA